MNFIEILQDVGNILLKFGTDFEMIIKNFRKNIQKALRSLGKLWKIQ